MDGELKWIYMVCVCICAKQWMVSWWSHVILHAIVGDVLYVYVHVVGDTSCIHMSCLMDGEYGRWNGFLYPNLTVNGTTYSCV
jgi:hypothetical protein